MPRDPNRVELADRIRLEHMIQAARSAVSFMQGRSRSELDTNELLARGVVHAIQEIGEAASRVSESGRARVPGVPWTKIVGMRHRLVHVYWGINLNLVYEVVVSDLPAFITAIQTGVADWPLPLEPDA